MERRKRSNKLAVLKLQRDQKEKEEKKKWIRMTKQMNYKTERNIQQ